MWIQDIIERVVKVKICSYLDIFSESRIIHQMTNRWNSCVANWNTEYMVTDVTDVTALFNYALFPE